MEFSPESLDTLFSLKQRGLSLTCRRIEGVSLFQCGVAFEFGGDDAGSLGEVRQLFLCPIQSLLVLLGLLVEELELTGWMMYFEVLFHVCRSQCFEYLGRHLRIAGLIAYRNHVSLKNGFNLQTAG